MKLRHESIGSRCTYVVRVIRVISEIRVIKVSKFIRVISFWLVLHSFRMIGKGIEMPPMPHPMMIYYSLE